MTMNKKECRKEYADKNRDLLNSIEARYYRKNREKILSVAKEAYLKNKDARIAYAKEYYRRNREKILAREMTHRSDNSAAIRESQRQSKVKRRANDPLYRLRHNLARQIRFLLVNGKMRQSTESLLGYRIADLKEHLEKQFTEGMSWSNYGDWHIDHKTPICAFNITSHRDIDFKNAWALSNLQPLWKRENILKGGNVDSPFQPSLAINV